jgi:hypothetical protein
VTVTVREDGFAVTGDAALDANADDDQLFAYGTAAPTAEAGMTLPNLRMLAQVHGWDVTLERTDETRIVVADAETALGGVADGSIG